MLWSNDSVVADRHGAMQMYTEDDVPEAFHVVHAEEGPTSK